LREQIIHCEVDTGEFKKDLTRYFDSLYPEAMARGFRSLSMLARDAARQRTGEKYRLRSDFIPRGIVSAPFTDGQVDAAARSYAKHHDLIASVFLRPASNPHQGLGFMVNHETGKPVTPSRGAALAVPSYGIEQYSFRNSRGSVKTPYKPGKLLEGYHKEHLPPHVLAAMGAESTATPKKKGKKGRPFVGQTSKGVGIIGRRKGSGRLPIEVLYVFKAQVRSDGDWGFETTIRAEVRAKYVRTLGRYLNR